MKIVSLFSGAGGMDLGFEQAGFEIIQANEYDKHIWKTYRKNFSNTYLEKESIVKIKNFPEADGLIGGPPCQSWSVAGSKRGINDSRGQLFFDFIRALKQIKPKFFVAENVQGILSKRNEPALKQIIKMFEEAGYIVSYKLLNAKDYNIAQDRKRVFFVGFRKKNFVFPEPLKKTIVLKDIIYDLRDNVVEPIDNTYHNENCLVSNHEYFKGGFSSIFLSRNRVRAWDEVSFTIQATARHIPLHPQAPKMILLGKDKRGFVPEKEKLYRRLSIRECARIQSFPDQFEFLYDNLIHGYKMVGNAVPPELARVIAEEIKKQA